MKRTAPSSNRKLSPKTNTEEERACLQTPHTLRLLKLIREGTEEYAQLALERLDVDEGNKEVLWDLLGRLQEILKAPQWRTRQAAATALEQVAKSLGDGEQFWLRQEGTSDGSLLTVDSLDVHRVLQRGRKLYAVAESVYENEEDLDQATSVKERLRLQRQLLARRLGLGSICSAVGNDLLPDAITDEDMLQPTPKKQKSSQPSAECPADMALLPDSETPFRTLLVKSSTSKTPQALLATELLVGIMDPVWSIRHGSLLGLLSLVRAWKGTWGPWLHDALVRVLSVGTLLDRFGDFGGSDSVVAPVREMAGQLASVLIIMADGNTRERIFKMLVEVGNDENMEWEVRHGVMLLFKFLVVADSSSFQHGQVDYDPISETQRTNICDHAVRALADKSDDVKSAAAQVLLELAHGKVDCGVWSCAESLWFALRTANEVASYVKDLVLLFVVIIEKNCERFLELARCEVGEVVSFLLQLLDSEFDTIRVAAMRSIGLVCGVLSLWNIQSFELESVRLVERVFDTFALHSAWGVERDNTWDELCSVRSPSIETTHLLSLLKRFFTLRKLTDGLPLESARALAKFLEKRRVGPLLEVSIVASLQSPWPYQCEAACLVFRIYAATLNADAALLQTVSGLTLRLGSDLPSLIFCVEEVPSFRELWERKFRGMLENVASGNIKANVAVDSLLQLRDREFKNALDQSVPSDVLRMRVSTTVVGAHLACGIPQKATPIVRLLMTSLKNETSQARLSVTCDYIVNFMTLAVANGQHAKATSKILSTLCDAAISQANDRFESAASEILKMLTRSLPQGKGLEDSPSVSDHFSRILDEDTSDLSGLEDGIRLVHVLAKGLETTHSARREKFFSLAGSLVRLAAHSGLHDSCSASLVTLSGVSPGHLLNQAIPALIPLLRKPSANLSSCRLLQNLIGIVESKLCPFIRVLLPAVLSLVSDRNCGKYAYEVFASLVRIAPLVDRQSVRNVSVFDHLIFAEPLPTCELPVCVTSALSQANISLRAYQEEGIAWLQFLQSVGLSDMGLGKTLQALIGVSLAHERSSASRSLVVCPSTLVSHWAYEVEKYFPAASVYRVLCLTGNRIDRFRSWERSKDQCNLVVVSYAVLRSDIGYLADSDWCYCILDEGHLMKNPRTETAKAARRLQAKHKLIMTGTPIQNKVDELFSVFDFLMPNFLGDFKSFSQYFGNPITKGQLAGSNASAIVEGISKLKQLHQQVLPFLLRREKDDVLTELPPKITTVVNVPLSGIQQRMYDKFCANEKISNLENLEHFDQRQGTGDFSAPEGTLKALLYLRLLCTHPILVFDPSDKIVHQLSSVRYSGKLMALTELLREAGFVVTDFAAADNDQSLLYCGDVGLSPPNNPEIIEDPEDVTGCLDRELVAGQNSKCLIFAQFTKTLQVVEEFVMQPCSCKYVRLDGSVPAKDRMGLVNQFNNDPSTRIMLLTTRVGGVGLNLTAADIVIFVEHDYNPQSDLQAIDRARRIGQKKVVKVYKIVAENTIDEKLLLLQAKKLRLSEAIVNTDNSTMYTMGTDRLLDIFSTRSDQLNKGNTDVDLDRLTEHYISDYKSLSSRYFADILER